MRAMQGTIHPVRTALGLTLLFACYAPGTSASSYTTVTSTTTIATKTTTITITLAYSAYTSTLSSSESTSTTSSSTSTSPSKVSIATTITTATESSTSLEASATTSMVAALENVVLNSTNWYRDQHQADHVTWNSTLADFAEDYAKKCIWKHSGGPYGENLAANYENATLAIDAWGNEEENYNYAKQKFTEDNGHFTQLVWKNTTSVGCGMVDCANDSDENGVQGQFLVCEYSPRGNVVGEFGHNVGKAGQEDDGTPGLGSGAAGLHAGAGRVVAALVAACLFSTLIF